MKRNLFHFAVIAIIFSFLSSCIGYSQKEEIRKTGPFTGIGLAVSADLYLSQGDNTEVKLEGSSDLLAKVETVVEKNTLKIRYKHRAWGWNIPKGPLKIYVTMPEVKRLYLAGSGNIKARTPVNGDKIDLAVSGSGDIAIDHLSANIVNIKISGSGDIRVAGEKTVDAQEIAISGSGDVLNKDLSCKKANIRISGSGGAQVNVQERLEAAISGSGEVLYKGSPLIDALISGSGHVKPMK